MIKIKPFLMLLFVFCIVLVGCLAGFQQTYSGTMRPEKVAATQSKRDLAIAVLSETEISKRYDLYLGNSVDVLVPLETTRNSTFMEWMQTLFVQEAGWSFVEEQYVVKLEEIFSEAELRELLALGEQPLLRRLVQAEMEAYSVSAEKRRTLLSTLWNNYNSGVFTPPPEVLQ